MIIGIPKEIKDNEYRVAVTPGGAHQLVEEGHQVLLERGAGEGSGFADDIYAEAGAEVIPDAAEVCGRAEMIMKVKEPLPQEYGHLRKGLILYTYLHLAANEDLTRELIARQVTGIAYETVELPDGSKASIPRNQVEVRENRTHERIENAIKIAEQMMGSRYAWGGKTSEGVDCSGLIQSSFRSQGINMPRDAYQQAYVGSLVATRWYREGLRRGDTLFFLGRTGRISHVAIYLGDDQYLEASRGDVHYTSFNPKHDNFNERKLNIFCFAKRVLD